MVAYDAYDASCSYDIFGNFYFVHKLFDVWSKLWREEKFHKL